MHRTFAFHKPVGLTIEQGRPATHGTKGRGLTLNDYLQRFYPSTGNGLQLSAVGRLDKDTSGLMILTTDGVLNEEILRPGTLTKVYEATIKLRAPHRPTSEQLKQLVTGIELNDGYASAEAAEIVAEWVQPATPVQHPESARIQPSGNWRKRKAAAVAGGSAMMPVEEVNGPEEVAITTEEAEQGPIGRDVVRAACAGGTLEETAPQHYLTHGTPTWHLHRVYQEGRCGPTQHACLPFLCARIHLPHRMRYLYIHTAR